MIARRAWLLHAASTVATPALCAPSGDDDAVRRGRVLRFPRDHGAHPGTRTEWWYLTGWLQPEGAPVDAHPRLGFQITFFRSRTGLGEDAQRGRFVPRQLLFAHAALTDLIDDPKGRAPGQGQHRHAQRIARWNGDDAAALVHARRDDTAVRLERWHLRRELGDGAGERFVSQVDDEAAGFALDLAFTPTQPMLLQGDAGWSQKGPSPQEASHYVSWPQLAVRGTVARAGTAGAPARREAVRGRAWLDHEWSDQLLSPGAQGWDWLGINLADGGALTAFRLREAAGGSVWAGGSHRSANGRLTVFGPQEVHFEPLRWWTSPTTGARYPVTWRLRHPLGVQVVQALLDAQELDSRGSTGSVYWEGLSELRDEGGRALGLGYLEMTGYAGTLKL